MVEENKVQQVEDAYDSGKYKKWVDFCLGFFSLPIIMSILFLITKFIPSEIYLPYFAYYIALSMIILGGGILSSILLLKSKRRYIGIALLCFGILIPLLLFGACFVAMAV